MKKIFFFLLLSCLTVSIYAQDKISKGARVSILEIAKGDTYYDERIDFLGKEATALGDLNKNPNGFYSGTLEVDGGRTCFFKNVKVSKISDPKKSTVDTKSILKGTIPKGTAFKIVEISTDDSYYKDRSTIEGKTGITTESITTEDDGFLSGSLKTSDGDSYYFFKVKLAKNGTSTSSSTSTSKTVKFVTGTILKGTALYLAEISTDDSYYSDRFEKVGKKGKVTKQNMTMKEDGYYAGDFTYDDGSTAYFYKAKFSKTPVDKLIPTEADKVNTSSDDDVWGDIYSSSDDSEDWSSAKNDDDIYEGDKVKIVAVSKEDSYYDDRADYIGQEGVAGDIDYDADENAYGGKIKLDNGDEPYFYLVKLVKIKKSSTSSSTSTSKETISKSTKVKVVDIDSDDSFYSNRSTYIGKSGKVAESLTHQGDGFYSGKILFNDGTDAYFYKAKITILK
jgi:hypothetical protein